MDFLVVGGRQGRNALRKEEWHRYKCGVVARVSSNGKEVEVCLEYESPPDVCPYDKDPSILFKAGSLADGQLYLCTQTEVLVYDASTFEGLGYLSLPLFNDLHHVLPGGDGSILVAVTGLDMVVKVNLDGKILREWGVIGQDPWQRFSRETDYRHILTTKPHHSHPNYLFRLDGQIWVTRFEQRDAVSLTSDENPIQIGLEKPHDGIVYDDRVYFTTVNGRVVIADAAEKQVLKVVDLNDISRKGYALGWCRGIAVLEPNLVIVGFTRIRPTKFRENLRWIRYELGLRETNGNLPARVVCYDLARLKELWEIDLETFGMNAIFSIHPLS